MDTAGHRKIELQSASDLSYLVSNVSRAARAKIDLHLPPSAAPEGGDDALRRRVEELVHEYVQTTFAHAKHNITVNGLDATDPSLDKSLTQEIEEFEPYNSHLAARVQSLYATLELETQKVAQLRRDGPRNAATIYRERFMAEQEEADTAFQARADLARNAVDHQLEMEKLERIDDTEHMWARSLDRLMSLKGSIPETAAKLERAKAASEHLDRR